MTKMEVFLQALQFLGVGMAGIFIITGIIVILVTLFIRLFPSAEDKK